MSVKANEVSDIIAAKGVLELSQRLLEKAINNVGTLTNHGRAIDDHQVLVRKIASLATRIEAAFHLLEYGLEYLRVHGEVDTYIDLSTRIFICEVARDLLTEAHQSLEDFGLDENDLRRTLWNDLSRLTIRHVLSEKNFRALGRFVLDGDLDNNRWIWAGGDEETELRTATRRFARDVVAPQAEEIHRKDLLVPESLIEQMAELGYFGMSIPIDYGGVGMSNLMMIIATEELSAASLSASGSLITRPEILAKALLKGGTEEQKRKWLEPVASGKLMVGVAVTEPNIGSDVASLACRATQTTQDGVEGWLINGSKAWCTFAGRANILALLARTNPDPKAGHRGLSLFIVEKDAFDGHEFEMTQSGGGKMVGRADATPGYRGMHSFTLKIEDYFVPAENLVGGKDGEGRGFYLQMDGFAAGRLQTGGRGLGLAQASLEAAAQYALERPQFGKPIAEFQSTEYEIGIMATQIEAARQLTYSAARAMDEKHERATLLAAMAKLFASRVAVEVSQRAQVIHGGWGYAEEYPISRYTVDALVLPIFEGVEPILEMKVIGRGLLAQPIKLPEPSKT